MVDNQNLIIELSKLGTVVFCDVANEHCWNVIVENSTSNAEDLKSLCDSYLIPTYDTIISLTLEDNIFKASYFKESN